MINHSCILYSVFFSSNCYTENDSCPIKHQKTNMYFHMTAGCIMAWICHSCCFSSVPTMPTGLKSDYLIRCCFSPVGIVGTQPFMYYVYLSLPTLIVFYIFNSIYLYFIVGSTLWSQSFLHHLPYIFWGPRWSPDPQPKFVCLASLGVLYLLFQNSLLLLKVLMVQKSCILGASWHIF
jgi:hypothetical protein